jgi:hypothetical protein
MTHGSRNPGTAWESKCGSFIRISHIRDQLNNHPLPGSLYGDIVVSFRPAAPGSVAAAATTATVVEIVGPAEVEHVARIDSVVKPLKASFSLADEFEVKFEAWKATWFSEALQLYQRYCFGRFP